MYCWSLVVLSGLQVSLSFMTVVAGRADTVLEAGCMEGGDCGNRAGPEINCVEAGGAGAGWAGPNGRKGWWWQRHAMSSSGALPPAGWTLSPAARAAWSLLGPSYGRIILSRLAKQTAWSGWEWGPKCRHGYRRMFNQKTSLYFGQRNSTKTKAKENRENQKRWILTITNKNTESLDSRPWQK